MGDHKLDLLAFSAHPDDVELAAGGTLLLHAQKGWKTGIVDFTQGEMGTRGSAELRKEESVLASEVLGLSIRENLYMDDCFFQYDRTHLMKVIHAIRTHKPRIVLINAPSDRHPDHGRASKIQADACFYSGLSKIETGLPAWRPKLVYQYIQDQLLEPTFAINIASVWEAKMQAVLAYKSQFYSPDSQEPQTPISSATFLEFLKARALQMGRSAGIELAEGFIALRTPVVADFDVLG